MSYYKLTETGYEVGGKPHGAEWKAYTVGSEPAELKVLMDAESLQGQMEELESMIDPHIMRPIDDYNKLNGLRFASPQNCKDWSEDATYEHQAFCISAWNFHKNVYKHVRAYQAAATEVPTVEEFQAVLDAVVF